VGHPEHLGIHLQVLRLSGFVVLGLNRFQGPACQCAFTNSCPRRASAVRGWRSTVRLKPLQQKQKERAAMRRSIAALGKKPGRTLRAWGTAARVLHGSLVHGSWRIPANAIEDGAPLRQEKAPSLKCD
jgi:hypothetical protein